MLEIDKDEFKNWVRKQPNSEEIFPKGYTSFSTPTALYLQEKYGIQEVSVTKEGVRIENEIHALPKWVENIEAAVESGSSRYYWERGNVPDMRQRDNLLRMIP